MVSLPLLPEIPVERLSSLVPPQNRIRTEDDVLVWKTTKGYQNYLLFLRRLNESVVGRVLPKHVEEAGEISVAVKSMLFLLDQLDTWINEIPPLNTPQRFGNRAFQKWGARLEQNSNDLLETLLPESLHPCIQFVKPYLLTCFGSFTRMDYGTGHETSFGLFLLCLTLVRYFQPIPEEERHLVFVVFMRYLRLCWRLQDVYRLEPAGSHGVWGLDDYCFLGYLFGSGQLRDQADIPVNAILRPPLPSTNLYFLLITRIREVKSGPFHEHSPQLYSVAVNVQNWAKVNSGMFKMYEAEVLGKRVVVQHIPVGGLLEWDASDSSSVSTPVPSQTFEPITHAPWASSSVPRGVAVKRIAPLSPPSDTQAHGHGGWTSTTTSTRPLDRTLMSPPPPRKSSDCEDEPDVAKH